MLMIKQEQNGLLKMEYTDVSNVFFAILNHCPWCSFTADTDLLLQS